MAFNVVPTTCSQSFWEQTLPPTSAVHVSSHVARNGSAGTSVREEMSLNNLSLNNTHSDPNFKCRAPQTWRHHTSIEPYCTSTKAYQENLRGVETGASLGKAPRAAEVKK
eukprot:3502008-Amphidinium_carterae.1